MPDDPQYRSTHTHSPDAVALRDSDEVDGDEGMMEVRMPIASTGDVRNEGDDPLSPAELRGMAQQVDSLTRGVFPEHGASEQIDYAGYSQFEKLGYWANADLKRDASADEEDLLVATARMPDPETLPAATGDYQEALAILKEQAKRGIPIGSSIGWRDDPDAPGGVDLMEASIVGIGADPRTTTQGGEQLVARAAVEAGADPEALVEAVRAAVDADGGEDTSDTEDTHDMTDDDTAGEEAGTDAEQDADDADETTERADEECPECETAVRDDANFCRECGTDLREDDEEEEEEDDDEDEEQAADAPDEEQGADASELEERLAALEDELAAVRSGEVDIDTPDPDETDDERESDEPDDERDTTADDTDPAAPPEWARGA